MTCQKGTNLGVCVIDNWEIKIQKQQNNFVNGSYAFVDGKDWNITITGLEWHFNHDTDYKDGRLGGSYFKGGSDSQQMIDWSYDYCTRWCNDKVEYQDIFPCVGGPYDSSIKEEEYIKGCNISMGEFKAYNPSFSNGPVCCTKPYYGAKKDGTCHTHTMSDGETCKDIGSWYGITEDDIKQWNGGCGKVGDNICVSQGKIPQQNYRCNGINNGTRMGTLEVTTGTTGMFLDLSGYLYDGKNHTCNSTDGRYVNCDNLGYDLMNGNTVIDSEEGCHHCVSTEKEDIPCKDYCKKYTVNKKSCA
jgi:hypothetical protein